MGRGGGGVPFSFGDILSGGARHGGNVGGRFTEMLRQIKRKEDPTMQMVALQELAEILSMATGISIASNSEPFSCCADMCMGMTAAELGYGGVEMMNPELMLLACRCLSNLIEAHPSSTMHVLQHGAVQVLVGKLMEVEYIDLAEQVLSVLDKISLDYPAAIIRANGLLAVLQYIDFFGLHVQRTAVTIAANASESENDDVFNKVKEVIPTLERLLGYSDTKLVEQTVRALDRIVDWAWKDQTKLESIITPGLLQTIVGAINLNGMSGTSGAGAIPSVFTKLVKLVVNVANGSPKLATSLLVDHGIVDVLKNYLTGGLDIRLLTELEEETDMETISAAVTNVVVSRPPHQVLEVVKLASAILPSLPADGIWQISAPASSSTAPKDKHSTAETKPEGPSKAQRHLELLKAHPEAVRSYSTLLLPIFLEVFGVTVNALLRRTVVECVAKGIWYLDDQDYLTKALAKNRVFGKFVPELLGLRETAFKTLGADKERKEALVLVSAGVQIALVVMDRCGERFKAWFAREGAMEEMTKIVGMKLDDEEQPIAPPSPTKTERTPTAHLDLNTEPKDQSPTSEAGSSASAAADASMRSLMDKLTRSDDSSSSSLRRASGGASKVVVLNGASCTEAEVKAWIVDRCRTILDSFPTAVGTGLVLSMLRELGDTLGRDGPESLETLQKVARHFTGTGDADGGIGVTGFEMLESGILHALAEFLATPGYTTSVSARLKAFLHVFMNGPTTDPRNRAFYVPGAFKRLVQTLQESLSRVERFEVAAGVPSSATARHQSAFSLMYGSAGAVHQRESSNPSLQLTRQLKLKLAAADPDAVPKQYHALLISVHAVATYKALEDYLKSRVVTPLGSEPPRSETKPSTTATDVTPTTTAAAAAGAATSSSSQNEVEMKDADHAHECGAECEHDDDEDEDEDEEEDDEDAMDDDEAAHAHHFEHDDDDEDEDEDDDLDGDVSSQTGTPPDGATNQPEDPTGPRRDSVIDVRAEGSARPSSAAPSATPTKAQSSSTLTPPASYAAAAASAAQEFDIEFSIGDAPVPTHSTVFASLYRYANKTQRVPDVWGHVFTVTWRKVPKPSDSDKDTNKQKRASSSSLPFSTVLPDGISLEHADGQVLNLLRILHEGSQPMERVAGTARTHAPVRVEVLPPAAFANTKLTAKLNRQLDEPLIVASDVLPTWCAALAKHFSFLVPFETRLVYLQSTSFGYSRSMGRWQQQQNQNQGGGGNGSGAGGGGGGSGGDGGAQMLGRIQRQKVRIARNRILDSMIRVMELYGSTQALLEVEFFDEVGTGLGPTLEFYSTVCRDVRTRGGIALGNSGKRIKVWRDDDGAVDALQEQNGPMAYLNPTLGFFPAPMAPDHAEREDGKRALSLFQALGTFVAKALLDSRLIDLPFSPIFLEMVVGEEEEQESALELALGPKGRTCAEFHLVRHVDPSLYKALLELKSYTSSSATVRGASIEDLCLDFTLPGYPEIELCPGGKDVAVTASNVRAYVESVVEMTVGTGVAKQIKAFRTGFDAVFPATDLASFSVQELAVLVGGTGDEDDDKEGGGTWSAQSLREAIRTDHGFNAESPTIAHLITYMSQLSGSARRDFLQFVTGSPKLPVGGFKNLNPPLTVIGEGTPTLRTANDYLPSVMTCANYLKVPEYRDVETLKARFDLAVKEGQGCFHLS
ncbi:hypothetical protein DFJ77DRAFT_433488 [Powellomyces hirtus]|nr:hypothetical protein DFJ77DRAFT_433488 [Powellomyces hirtus]